jgi:acetyl coenzyme A synthetase (ADP forming)-like protein
VAGPADRVLVAAFFRELSDESRYQRFFTASQPPDSLLDRFCEHDDPRRSLTLIAVRRPQGADRIVALASYAAITTDVAEAAFAVADDFQGRGIGTLLLEELAAQALAQGFRQFHATTLSTNAAMLDVFRESGFEIRSKLDHGCTDVQLSLTLPLEGVAAVERRRRRATVESLRPLIAPRSVAVIGASRDRSKIGSRILGALKGAGFQGRLHVVHREAPSLEGIEACPSARQLPPGVDVAVIAVPAAAVPAVVDDCAASGVRSLIVVSAGFSEVGAAGRQAQEALLQQVRGYGMRMIGPNCLGVLNADPALRLNASFAPAMPAPGRVAFSSQSGALGIAILELAAERHVGLSAFVSVGNKADISGNDLLEYWEDDPGTAVILLYLESFGNPRRFARIASRVGRTKPIVALKSGRTQAGCRAAGSHTGALAGSDAAVTALFRQSGVMRAETIDEMFDIAACLDTQPLPSGNRVAIVTNAGGPGILAADACDSAGLTMAVLSDATRDRLAARLPATASLQNPVDMVAAAGGAEFQSAIEAVLADPAVDALITIFVPVDVSKTRLVMDGIAAGIAAARAAGARQKPVLASLMSAPLRAQPVRAGAETVPVYAFPEHAVRALGQISSYAAWRGQPASLYWDFEDVRAEDARAVCDAALARGGDVWLTPDETATVMRAYGLPIIPSRVARSPEEAEAVASLVGYPVAAKIVGPGVVHKTEIGGVRLGLAEGRDVREAFTALVTRGREAAGAAAVDGVLIQPMVAGGVETIVGMTRDPIFGPLVGFGIGGVDVEVLGDVHFRVVPLSDRDAGELLRETRGFRLLEGHRGRPAADLGALQEVLLRTSRLAEDVPAIVELDLNPAIALPAGRGCRIVDARIRVGSVTTPAPSASGP